MVVDTKPPPPPPHKEVSPIPLLFRKLVERAYPYSVVKDSFLNYHAKGVDYLCLLRTPQLTAKAYFLRRDRIEHNDAGLIVWPHSHRYAFEHWTLEGSIEHRVYQIAGGDTWRLHEYDADDRKARPLISCGLSAPEVSVLEAGAYFAMEPNQIHSIALAGYHDAIALQLQYADVERRSTLFAPAAARVECFGDGSTGLYQEMSGHTAGTLLDELLGALVTL